MSRKNVTISDIARETGVSIATVSRILNRKGNVREETRQRVMSAIKNLDAESTLAHKLKGRDGKLIVAVICDGDNPVVAPFISGVQHCAVNKGYHVMQFNCLNRHNDVRGEFEFMMNELPIAGFVLQNTLGDSSLTDDIAAKLPTVVGFEQYLTDDISCVGVDDFAASRSAVEYLISIGRKKIALLNSDFSMPFAARREEGYKAALEQAGMEINPEYILHISDFNYNLARNAALQILNLKERPDAFFAITDTFAAAVMKEANRLGLSVPGDVAIVGFDNTDVSSMTDPAITTVSQPSYQIGYQSCSVLLEKIANPQIPSRQIWVNSEFIVRGSTQ